MLLEESGACLASPEEKLAIVPAVPVRTYFYSSLFSSQLPGIDPVGSKDKPELKSFPLFDLRRVHPPRAVGHSTLDKWTRDPTPRNTDRLTVHFL
ncbi:hypothetical protein CEXT_125551 [Caerostris extrusa]|uniref:Uncharacterized protein n=1 Tax=Caerostris extrusa TaxID=172846 RepID=A0AAV4NYQ8_CAEEX|nr:hypothetical protein CEXT_125551 [Caerostris extrusa]